LDPTKAPSLDTKPKPFVYHMIPREGFGKAPFYRQDGGPVDGHTSIRYPYTALGRLTSHVHPHFVIVNAALKMNGHVLDYLKNTLLNLQPYYPNIKDGVAARNLLRDIMDIYEKWMIKSGGSGATQVMSVSFSESDEDEEPTPPKRPKRRKFRHAQNRQATPHQGPFHGDIAQGSGGGGLECLGNPGLIADDGSDSPKDDLSCSTRISNRTPRCIPKCERDANDQLYRARWNEPTEAEQQDRITQWLSGVACDPAPPTPPGDCH
jgi:hypothetical protein